MTYARGKGDMCERKGDMCVRERGHVGGMCERGHVQGKGDMCQRER